MPEGLIATWPSEVEPVQPWSAWAAKMVAALLLAMTLSACISLPSNGPTGAQIRKSAIKSASAALPYTIVPIDGPLLQQLHRSENSGVAALGALSTGQQPTRADLIRRGDTLNINIFEVGVNLFGAGPVGPVPEAIRTPSATSQVFTTQVGEDGQVTLPYIGTVTAAGSYPEALAAAIKQRLRRYSENPEALVSVTDSLQNVVYVGGVVARSGRYRLTSAHERLLDLLALAGGSPVDINELQLTLVRDGRSISVPLNQISLADPANILLMPGDRIELARVRQSYTVFGATDKVSQVPFDAKNISLAEAVARVAGPSDARANPRGVFVFRLDKDKDGAVKATVYQLDMLSPQSYFVAQMFPMQDKDVVVFANSSSNALQKFIGLFNQVFGPASAVLYATK